MDVLTKMNGDHFVAAETGDEIRLTIVEAGCLVEVRSRGSIVESYRSTDIATAHKMSGKLLNVSDSQ